MILGIDPGERRIGIALADEETRFARPLEVIDVTLIDPLVRIGELVGIEGVSLVVVGRPLSLSGRAGPAVETQSRFVEQLRAAIDVDVIEHDERLTTVIAESGLKAAGGDARRRKELRDAVAAQVMLQSYLDGTASRER